MFKIVYNIIHKTVYRRIIMLKKFIDLLLENSEIICAGIITMNGGYYRPYDK